jgi:peptidase M1-like protein/immune inhibitor InhA-like protein
MKRSLVAGLATAALVIGIGGFGPGSGAAAPGPKFSAGAPGAGDPYFPRDGNGGYDTEHYDLDVEYDPATDVLTGVATLDATATQNLSKFNLDLDGLTVRSVLVNGAAAKWSRAKDELTITPTTGILSGTPFTVEIRYDGVPATLPNGFGFIHTDDGALVMGQPQVADTWYPVNDHPSDKASYTFHITVPSGLEAIANGELVGSTTSGGKTTWTWDAAEPMASYLTTATIGEFDLRSYQAQGIPFWDALDPDLYDPASAPRTGNGFALSQLAPAAQSYKRLSHTMTVPAGGGELTAWIDRDTEPLFDFVFVEVHTVGADDWTTLPDLNGHTSQSTDFACPYWLPLHPFLEHYQTQKTKGCKSTGSTGEWNAATGDSDGYEQWRVDLGAFAGRDVEVAITYVSDDAIQESGVYVDDITGPGGQGTTSFEADGDPADGWTVPGAPADSPTNENDWIIGTAADLPPSTGESVDASFDRHGEILGFLSDTFGPYPFSASGGVVDDPKGAGFALENQTRPVYSRDFFSAPGDGDSVVVHELAHQWFGDSLAVARWQHIWLNEGFATYAEWLWSEDQDLGTAQEIFDFWYNEIPPDDPFWQIVVGDPGPANLFDGAIYIRGAMTLHQLRLAVGDDDFHTILTTWAADHEGGNVTTDEFIALAEQVSGQQLDGLFQTWLFTAGRPDLGAGARTLRAASETPPAAAQSLIARLDAKRLLG